MGDPEQREIPNVGDAVWAHHKWPRIGLFTGFGVGVILAFLFVLGWWAAIVFVIAVSVFGCLMGFLLASVIYRTRGY